jgi:hypothetical protein
MSSVQNRNSEMINLLRGEFQGRYEPQFASQGIASRILQLTALRGYWPFSSVDAAGGAYDESANVNHLTNNNVATFNYGGLVPYAELDGTNQYFSIADNALLSIIGTEAYIDSAVRGMTLGGWFWIDTFVNFARFMAKDVSPNNSYGLRIRTVATQAATFQVSGNGVAFVLVDGGNNELNSGAWNHVVGRFTPSTELAIFVNGNKTINAAGVPASIFDGASAFAIGANSVGANPLDGRVSNCWVCAAALSDSIINNMFNQDKAAYGVE